MKKTTTGDIRRQTKQKIIDNNSYFQEKTILVNNLRVFFSTTILTQQPSHIRIRLISKLTLNGSLQYGSLIDSHS